MRYNKRRFTKERMVGAERQVYDSDTGMWIALYLLTASNSESSQSVSDSLCHPASANYGGGGGDFGGGGSSVSYDSGGSCDSGSCGCD